jgi:hypothetical protein
MGSLNEAITSRRDPEVTAVRIVEAVDAVKTPKVEKGEKL